MKKIIVYIVIMILASSCHKDYFNGFGEEAVRDVFFQYAQGSKEKDFQLMRNVTEFDSQAFEAVHSFEQHKLILTIDGSKRMYVHIVNNNGLYIADFSCTGMMNDGQRLVTTLFIGTAVKIDKKWYIREIQPEHQLLWKYFPE